jgi:hypothetical protein
MTTPVPPRVSAPIGAVPVAVMTIPVATVPIVGPAVIAVPIGAIAVAVVRIARSECNADSGTAPPCPTRHCLRRSGFGVPDLGLLCEARRAQDLQRKKSPDEFSPGFSCFTKAGGRLEVDPHSAPIITRARARFTHTIRLLIDHVASP